MVCHKTFKDEKGNWFSPNEYSEKKNKEKILIGKSEKMSKSKKNVVDPDSILKNFGADTARLFMLSDSPPEKDLEWTDTGIKGAFKYLNKLWELVENNLNILKNKNNQKKLDSDNEFMLSINKTIHYVTEDYENFRFNRAIARIREFTNKLFENEEMLKKNGNLFKFLIENTLKILSPMVPHISEEIWMKLGNKDFLIKSKWPIPKKEFLKIENITLAIQVNGKLKDTIDIPFDTSSTEIEKKALASPKIIKTIGDNKPKKIIVVKNKIANIVI